MQTKLIIFIIVIKFVVLVRILLPQLHGEQQGRVEPEEDAEWQGHPLDDHPHGEAKHLCLDGSQRDVLALEGDDELHSVAHTAKLNKDRKLQMFRPGMFIAEGNSDNTSRRWCRLANT